MLPSQPGGWCRARASTFQNKSSRLVGSSSFGVLDDFELNSTAIMLMNTITFSGMYYLQHNGASKAVLSLFAGGI